MILSPKNTYFAKIPAIVPIFTSYRSRLAFSLTTSVTNLRTLLLMAVDGSLPLLVGAGCDRERGGSHEHSQSWVWRSERGGSLGHRAWCGGGRAWDAVGAGCGRGRGVVAWDAVGAGCGGGSDVVAMGGGGGRVDPCIKAANLATATFNLSILSVVHIVWCVLGVGGGGYIVQFSTSYYSLLIVTYQMPPVCPASWSGHPW